MILKPCAKCGLFVMVKRKLWTSWSKNMKEEDKVYCVNCIYDVLQSKNLDSKGDN